MRARPRRDSDPAARALREELRRRVRLRAREQREERRAVALALVLADPLDEQQLVGVARPDQHQVAQGRVGKTT